MSLNFYRNSIYYVQNALKKDYHELVHNQLKDSDVKFDTFKTHFKLFYKNPSCDPTNVIPMIEKCLLDALQDLEIIPNDNSKFHLSGSWEVVEQDKLNPRVEIEVSPA